MIRAGRTMELGKRLTHPQCGYRQLAVVVEYAQGEENGVPWDCGKSTSFDRLSPGTSRLTVFFQDSYEAMFHTLKELNQIKVAPPMVAKAFVEDV